MIPEKSTGEVSPEMHAESGSLKQGKPEFPGDSSELIKKILSGEQITIARDIVARVTGVDWHRSSGKRITVNKHAIPGTRPTNFGYFEPGEFTEKISDWSKIQNLKTELEQGLGHLEWIELNSVVDQTGLDVVVDDFRRHMRWAPKRKEWVERPHNPEGGVWCEEGEHYKTLENCPVKLLWGMACDEHAEQLAEGCNLQEEDWSLYDIPDDGDDPYRQISINQKITKR